MRLTNSDRAAFIKAVLDDVPQIDYDELARSKVVAWAVARMPEVVRAAYEQFPNYFSNVYYYTPGSLNCVYAIGDEEGGEIKRIDPEFYKELAALSDQYDVQSSQQRTLRAQLKGVIYGCTTLKKAEELLPEFKKYLPADRDGTVNRAMPVISNLVATLTEAGWPKDQPLAQGA